MELERGQNNKKKGRRNQWERVVDLCVTLAKALVDQPVTDE